MRDVQVGMAKKSSKPKIKAHANPYPNEKTWEIESHIVIPVSYIVRANTQEAALQGYLARMETIVLGAAKAGRCQQVQLTVRERTETWEELKASRPVAAATFTE